MTRIDAVTSDLVGSSGVFVFRVFGAIWCRVIPLRCEAFGTTGGTLCRKKDAVGTSRHHSGHLFRASILALRFFGAIRNRCIRTRNALQRRERLGLIIDQRIRVRLSVASRLTREHPLICRTFAGLPGHLASSQRPDRAPQMRFNLCGLCGAFRRRSMRSMAA